MVNQSRKLEAKIKELDKEISKCPAGKLLCARNGNGYKWYCRKDNEKYYIPKADRKLAEKLALRRYYIAYREDLVRVKKAVDYYLKSSDEGKMLHRRIAGKAGYDELLKPYFCSFDDKVKEWLEEPYERKHSHAENLIYNARNGIVVRSKSEMMIVQILYEKKIPFRYECALELGQMVFYPDFTLLHPQTGEIIYWEHFGMMDIPEYIDNAYKKLRKYNEHGILQDKNLIITTETRGFPLTYDRIEEVIERFFGV